MEDITGDLEILLTDLRKGSTPDLGLRGTSYRQWYQALENYGENKNLKIQQHYWEQVIDSYQPLPVDIEYEGVVKALDLKQEVRRLDVINTRALIQEVPESIIPKLMTY